MQCDVVWCGVVCAALQLPHEVSAAAGGGEPRDGLPVLGGLPCQ